MKKKTTKTYYELAPQNPIEHKISVNDGSITVTEQHTVSMLLSSIAEGQTLGTRVKKPHREEKI